jgi:small-conductance mechanosensitive channel
LAIPLGACIASLVFLFTVALKDFEAIKGCELSCLVSKLLIGAGVGARKKPTHVERVYLYLVYLFYVLINPIGNFFRLCLGTSNDEKRVFDNLTDDLVLALLLVSIFGYFFSDAFEWWLASSYIWLILNISFHKLKEIADIARPSRGTLGTPFTFSHSLFYQV